MIVRCSPTLLYTRLITYRAVRQVLIDDVDRAAGFLSEGGVPEAVLLQKQGAVAKQIGHELSVLERRDRVMLSMERTVSEGGCHRRMSD